METVTLVWTIAKVVLGISFVIFWHELGHFLLAKWNGVQVKTFSIGFPPTLARLFRYKETDYVIGWIPLGGYVRMLGDEEGEAKDPNNPAANDPGAYHNKSVWARMGIISAGVVLNVVLGLACYILAFKLGGLPETPPLVGNVAAGGPAYVAGMLPGDEIESIDGRKNVMFSDLTQVVAHSVDDQVVEFVVRRPGVDGPVRLPIEPVRDPVLEVPTIRVRSARTLKLLKDLPYLAPPGLEGKPSESFEGGDEIVRVGPEGGELVEVLSPLELDRVLARYRSEPLRFVVARAEGSESEPGAESSRTPAVPEERTITVPANRFVDLGFAPTLGKVVAIRKGSPAEQAGFRIGDRLVSVGGEPVTDPMRLPSLLYDQAGRTVSIEVRRPLPGDQEEPVILTVTPEGGLPWNETSWNDEPLNLDAIGLAVEVRPIVGWIRPGSEAEQEGLKPGDVIEAMTISRPAEAGESGGESKGQPETLTLELGPQFSYPAVFDQIQQIPRNDVLVRIKGRKEPLKLRPEPVDGWYDPRRGFIFDSLTRPMPPLNLAQSIERGTESTVTSIGSMYRLLQSLTQRRVGTRNIAGPVRIASYAFQIAGRSLAEFIQFIGMLSLNLAVVNFLPIPPLDGGKMVFLIGEAVRGRPVPESWQVAFSNAGVLLVLGLMAFVLFQDVWLSFFG